MAAARAGGSWLALDAAATLGHPAQEGLRVGPFLALLAAEKNEHATPEPGNT